MKSVYARVKWFNSRPPRLLRQIDGHRRRHDRTLDDPTPRVLESNNVSSIVHEKHAIHSSSSPRIVRQTRKTLLRSRVINPRHRAGGFSLVARALVPSTVVPSNRYPRDVQMRLNRYERDLHRSYDADGFDVSSRPRAGPTPMTTASRSHDDGTRRRRRRGRMSAPSAVSHDWPIPVP